MIVSCIIPAYNEADTVAAVVRATRSVTQVDEIIVVDDGSTDNTALAAQRAGAKVIALPENVGKGGALATGIAQAKGEVLVFLDADLVGLKPGHVSKLLEPVLANQADMATGVFANGRWITDLAQQITPLLSGQRALRREILVGIDLGSIGFAVEVALDRLARNHKLRVVHVPLPQLTHRTKEEKRGVRKGVPARLKMYREIVFYLTRAWYGLSRQWVRKRLGSSLSFRRLSSILLVLAVVSALTGGLDLRGYYLAEAQSSGLQPLPPLGDRVLIISPHPDDETLGAGGLIHQLARQGKQIQVVFLTSGDAFAGGARRWFDSSYVSPRDYRYYGRIREKEAIKAGRALGLEQAQITFLGFPDKGLADLWWNRWNPTHPLTSKATQLDHSPHTGDVYCGSALNGRLKMVLATFRPTDVFAPCPDESHPDHWAANVFTVASLQGLDPSPRLYFYLIHKGMWQVSPVWPKTRPLTPPASMYLPDLHWYKNGLSADDLRAKKAAVDCYQTQRRVMAEFLDNFLRPNEIFASWAPKSLPVAAAGNQYPAAVCDARGDTLGKSVINGTDLKAIYLASNGSNLVIRLETWDGLNPLATYRLGWYAISGNKVQSWIAALHYRQPSQDPTMAQFTRSEHSLASPSAQLSLSLISGPAGINPSSLQARVVGQNQIEVELPINLIQGQTIMVGAEVRIGPMLWDRTSWAPVRAWLPRL